MAVYVNGQLEAVTLNNIELSEVTEPFLRYFDVNETTSLIGGIYRPSHVLISNAM